jgi:heat shock protein HslJ
MKRNIFIGALILIFFTSFQQPKPKSLTGKWSLLSYIDVKTGRTISIDSLPGYNKDKGITYQFSDDGQKGEFSGKDLCNTISGKYELEYPNIIKIINFSSTKVYCTGDQYPHEYHLTNANSYEVSNDTLTFTYKDNVGFMKFLKVK